MTKPQRTNTSSDYDRYWTEPWAVRLLLESIDLNRWGPVAAEPCAGDGAIAEVLNEAGLDVLGGDLHPATPWPAVDATGQAALERYRTCNSIITNPPYTADSGRAWEVADNLLQLGIPTAMLLPESWIEPCRGRRSLLKQASTLPDRLIVLPRVHYNGPQGGGSNPGTSVWWIWNSSPGGQTKIEWRFPGDKQRAKKMGSDDKTFVDPAGNPNADIALVGEAPGRREVIEGEPFVGPSGKLLNQAVDRNDVWITNVVKYRPEDNETPSALTVQSRRPILEAELEAVDPELVIALGNTAQKALRCSGSVGEPVEQEHWTAVPLRHPAYALHGGCSQEEWVDRLAAALKLL